jgi:hypothetical protein
MKITRINYKTEIKNSMQKVSSKMIKMLIQAGFLYFLWSKVVENWRLLIGN